MAGITKRKLDDALDALDESVRPPAEKSFRTRTRPAAHRSAPTSTPALEALLSKRSLLPPSSTRTAALTPSPPPVLAKAKLDPSLTDYAPTSLACLLARLATFRIASYPPPKPRSLSAPSLALNGWINHGGKDRLLCGLCGKLWVLPTPSAAAGGWSGEAGMALMARAEDMIVEEHEPSCAWKTRASPRALYRVAWTGPKGAAQDVLDRAKGIEGSLGVGQPEVAHPLSDEEVAGVVESVALVARNAQLRRSPARSADAPEPPIPSTSALVLALFGWSLEPPPPKSPTRPLSTGSILANTAPTSPVSGAILACPLCQRRVGTWASTWPKKPFDVVREHRDFCPYIDPLCGLPSPLATDETMPAPAKAGWQVVKSLTIRYAAPGPSGEALAGAVKRAGVDEDLSATERQRRVVRYVRGLLSGR